MTLKSDVKSSRNSKGNRYSEATKKKALRLAKQGKTAKTIAAELNVSMFTVKDWKKKAGITRPYTPSPKQAASPLALESIDMGLVELATAAIQHAAKKLFHRGRVNLTEALQIGRMASIIHRIQGK